MGPFTHDHSSVISEPIKKISLENSLVNLQSKWILKLPPHFAYVATLHCLTLMSAKQAVNDRISRYCSYILRCAGIVNDQIKKGLLLSLRVIISF